MFGIIVLFEWLFVLKIKMKRKYVFGVVVTVMGFLFIEVGLAVPVSVGSIPTKAATDYITADEFNSIVNTIKGIFNDAGNDSIGIGTGSENVDGGLKFQVNGKVGADEFCNQQGENCITLADSSPGGGGSSSVVAPPGGGAPGTGGVGVVSGPPGFIAPVGGIGTDRICDATGASCITFTNSSIGIDKLSVKKICDENGANCTSTPLITLGGLICPTEASMAKWDGAKWECVKIPVMCDGGKEFINGECVEGCNLPAGFFISRHVDQGRCSGKFLGLDLDKDLGNGWGPGRSCLHDWNSDNRSHFCYYGGTLPSDWSCDTGKYITRSGQYGNGQFGGTPVFNGFDMSCDVGTGPGSGACDYLTKKCVPGESGSGLSAVATGPIIPICSEATPILKWEGTAWGCAAMPSGGGGYNPEIVIAQKTSTQTYPKRDGWQNTDTFVNFTHKGGVVRFNGKIIDISWNNLGLALGVQINTSPAQTLYLGGWSNIGGVPEDTGRTGYRAINLPAGTYTARLMVGTSVGSSVTGNFKTGLSAVAGNSGNSGIGTSSTDFARYLSVEYNSGGAGSTAAGVTGGTPGTTLSSLTSCSDNDIVTKTSSGWGCVTKASVAKGYLDGLSGCTTGKMLVKTSGGWGCQDVPSGGVTASAGALIGFCTIGRNDGEPYKCKPIYSESPAFCDTSVNVNGECKCEVGYKIKKFYEEHKKRIYTCLREVSKK